MKRCLSQGTSPPSSPVIARSKRNEPQVEEDNQKVEGATSSNISTLEADEEKLIFTQQINEVRNDSRKISKTEAKPSFQSLNSLLSSNSRQFLSSGCVLLDKTLAGGLRRGEITEVVGESSAGKTQFCLQFCVQAAS